MHALRPEKRGGHVLRLMHLALGERMGRNTEAYVDDIVVKTREGHTLVDDLEQTFANLHKVNIKLCPSKCAFEVPSRKHLESFYRHLELAPSAESRLLRHGSRRCRQEILCHL
jgi:hypothetical protein